MKPEYQTNYLKNIDMFSLYIILFLATLEKSISTVILPGLYLRFYGDLQLSRKKYESFQIHLTLIFINSVYLLNFKI